MANEEQLSILKQGVNVWNKWYAQHGQVNLDLVGANLYGVDLRKADLTSVNLSKANLVKAKLGGADLGGATLNGANLSHAQLLHAAFEEADLRKANLREADLRRADLSDADLTDADLGAATLNGANLSSANLRRANLSYASLRGANLREADLTKAKLVGTDLPEADLTEANLTEATLIAANLNYSNLIKADITNARISKCSVYGISVWDLKGEFKEQKDLIITPDGDSPITVDNIKVAQFVYLILNNKEVREVINTLTSKSVLILGRFAIPERKATLDALREKLREYDLLPIVFDFDRPTDKDFTETIKTLAGISYFVIADVTNPKSSPLELQATVPDYQIPFVPIIQEGESPFAMMVDLQKKYPWVLPTRSYDSIETLMAALKPGIIDPAVEMKNKLRLVKAQEQVTESLKDYLDKSL